MAKPAPKIPENRDYSSHDSTIPTVDMLVRPNFRYMAAKPGERVRIDAAELKRNPTADTLCTTAEYEAILEAHEEARHKIVAGRPAPTTDAIAEQIEAAGGIVKAQRDRDRAREARDLAAGRTP